MKPIVISLLLLMLVCPQVAAQDDKTSAFAMPHPETNEPGIWIPVWLQQIHLQTEAKLDTCTEADTAKTQQLVEKAAEAEASQKAAADLRVSLDGLETTVAGQEIALEEEKDTNDDLRIWAWTSTAVGVVALSVLTALLAGG